MKKANLSTYCVPRTFKDVGKAEDHFHLVKSRDRVKSPCDSNYGETISSSQEGQLWLYNGDHQSDTFVTS